MLECHAEIVRSVYRNEQGLDSERACSSLGLFDVSRNCWSVRIIEDRDRRDSGQYFLQELTRLGDDLLRLQRKASGITTRPGKACEHTRSDRVCSNGQDYWSRLRSLFCRKRCCNALNDNNVDVLRNNVSHEVGQSISSSLGVTELEDDAFFRVVDDVVQSCDESLKRGRGLRH